MLDGGVISSMIDNCIGINFMIFGLENFYPMLKQAPIWQLVL
jgi:hypothetical protein